MAAHCIYMCLLRTRDAIHTSSACCSCVTGKHDGDGKQLAAWQSMASGGAAAILGPTVTNPFDVVKVGYYK